MLAAIVLSLAATAWSVVRLRYDRASYSLDFLALQARPQKKAVKIPLCVGFLCVIGAFVADIAADPKAARPFLSALTTAIVLSCLLVQHYLQRIRALEAIVRLSRPDLYSKVRGEEI